MKIDWSQIDTVLLDMDGTLLDRYFDDYFWEHYVPEMYGLANGLDPLSARKILLGRYQDREGTLDWTDLDYWSDQLGLDIPALKIKVDHLIQVHPYVIDFLEYVRRLGKRLFLVTNAHSKTLMVKMNKIALGGFFDRVICAEEVGMPKEDVRFWRGLQRIIAFEPERTMLAEDTEKILHSARTYGIGHLIYVARPSSRAPVRKSDEFSSIVYFNELMV